MDKPQPLNVTDIEVVVYHGDIANDRYFAKVHFVGLGIYINSFSIQQSARHKGYWVSPPRHSQGLGRFTTTVDFDKNLPTWGIVERRALEAVEQYKRANRDKIPTVSNANFGGRLKDRSMFF